jgi:tetratricopeptide (TPR) repeat protein
MPLRFWPARCSRLGWLLVSLTVSRMALASDPRALYREGLELYDEREYESALERFAESFRTLTSPNSKLYVARCLRAIGRTEEAVAAYEQAAQLAKERAPVEAKYEQTYQNALRELAVLRPPPPTQPRYVAATWTAAGVGLVGFASFGVFGALARSRFESLESHCNPLPCPASETGHVESGHEYQTIANISLAIGITGAVAGVTLYVLGRPRNLPYGQLELGLNSVRFSGAF